MKKVVKKSAKPMMRKGSLKKYQAPTKDKSNEYRNETVSAHDNRLKNLNEATRQTYNFGTPLHKQDVSNWNEKAQRKATGSPTPYQKYVSDNPKAEPSDTLVYKNCIDEFSTRMGRPRKKGGSTKANKFAALAPPYNKATAADRIAGAKKSKSSKKK